jgi:putative tricarboxylic transport membrane protein
MNYVPFAGGGEALASLLGNQVAAGISGYGEFAEQVNAGTLRLLAISSDERQEGIDAPTLKEQGVDVDLFNWRGVFGPPNMSDADKAALVSMVEAMAGSEAWSQECAARNWTRITLTGEAFETFLAEDIERITAILKEIGLA